MTPDRALVDVAREAEELLGRLRAEGAWPPTPATLINLLSASLEAAAHVARLLELEAVSPGWMGAQSQETREQLTRDMRAMAAGFSLVFALSPGVEDVADTSWSH